MRTLTALLFVAVLAPGTAFGACFKDALFAAAFRDTKPTDECRLRLKGPDMSFVKERDYPERSKLTVSGKIVYGDVAKLQYFRSSLTLWEDSLGSSRPFDSLAPTSNTHPFTVTLHQPRNNRTLNTGLVGARSEKFKGLQLTLTFPF